MTGKQRWPWDGDTDLMKARRAALAYREHLLRANPEVCAAIDEAMLAYGETWITRTNAVVLPDDLLTTAEAAAHAGVSVKTIRSWRNPGVVGEAGREQLQVRSYNDHGWPLFLAAEVDQFAASTRRKRITRRAT